MAIENSNIAIEITTAIIVSILISYAPRGHFKSVLNQLSLNNRNGEILNI